MLCRFSLKISNGLPSGLKKLIKMSLVKKGGGNPPTKHSMSSPLSLGLRLQSKLLPVPSHSEGQIVNNILNQLGC